MKISGWETGQIAVFFFIFVPEARMPKEDLYIVEGLKKTDIEGNNVDGRNLPNHLGCIKPS